MMSAVVQAGLPQGQGYGLGAFGEALRKEREKRGITLDSVSDGTKISTRFLRALEAEQFDQLPGGVFNKGFVRAYARHVGLDEDKVVADYLVAAGLVPDAALEPHGGTDRSQGSAHRSADPLRITEAPAHAARLEQELPREFPWLAVALAVVLALVMLAAWGYFSYRAHRGIPAPSHALHPDTPKPVPSAAAAASPATATSLPPTGSTSPLLLVIHANQDSWLFVTADGVAQGETMLFRGSEKSVQADKDILLKAGNAGGLSFLWNGNRLPPQGEEGEVATLDFDRKGVKKIPPQIQP